MDFEKEKYNLRRNFTEYTFDYIPSIITDDLWEYYLDLFEKPFKLRTQWNKWIECASEFESIDALFEEKIGIIEGIKNDFDFKPVSLPEIDNETYFRTDRYVIDDGRYFSIDLCEAMMRLYRRHGFTNIEKWSELVEKYSNKTFFKCKPARITIHHDIMKYWSSLGYTLQGEFNDCTKDVLQILETENDILPWLKEHNINFSYVMGDNLLFKIPDDETYNLCLTKIQNEYIINDEYRCHLDIIEKNTYVLNNSFLFILYKSHLSEKTIVISKNDNVIHFYPQIYKQLYYNEPITKKDLTFGMGLETHQFKDKALIKPFSYTK